MEQAKKSASTSRESGPKIHCKYDELVDPKKLKPHPKNRNKHSKEQIERLGRILDYQGWRYPIKVSRSSGYVTSGHGRILAAKERCYERVPVNFQDYESEEQEYADVQSDNAIAAWAELDLSQINLDLQDLGPDFDIDLLGIKDFVLEPADKYGDKEDDNTPDIRATSIVTGDLFQLGNHRLLCGDSTKKEEVERLMNGEKADMVFTDPPYGVDYSGGTFGKREKLRGDDTAELYAPAARICEEFCDGPCYFWFSSNKGSCVLSAVEAVGTISALLIWHKTKASYGIVNALYKIRFEPCLYWKPNPAKNMRWVGPTDECTLWEIPKDGVNEFHPTQKPVALAERAIKNHEAKNVLDLFLGSGSTLIACEKTNRKCYGMEIDSAYCQVIIDRYMTFTGRNDVYRLNADGTRTHWSEIESKSNARGPKAIVGKHSKISGEESREDEAE